MTLRDLIIVGIVGAAGIAYALAQQATTPATVAIVCAYNSSPPTVASGNFVFVQCDTNGYLLTKAGP